MVDSSIPQEVRQTAVDRADTLLSLFEATLVGVIRAHTREEARDIALGLVEGGLSALEFTTNTPGCFDLVREFAAMPSIRPLTLGVGTVLARDHVWAAEEAGATFVVSPHTDPSLMSEARERSLVTIPGALTPNEILSAHDSGADVVKIFPVAAMGGASYVRAVRGPLSDIPLWVSGGVRIEDIASYLEEGVVLIGLTDALTGDLGTDPRTVARERTIAAIERLEEARSTLRRESESPSESESGFGPGSKALSI